MPWIITIFLGVAAILVIYRHKGNLKRLVEGTEKRFGTKQA